VASERLPKSLDDAGIIPRHLADIERFGSAIGPG
jgi:hypothetical protein